MIHTNVNAGVYGFRTTVKARSEDLQIVRLESESDCDKIRDRKSVV
jgi:hypothetical protein